MHIMKFIKKRTVKSSKMLNNNLIYFKLTVPLHIHSSGNEIVFLYNVQLIDLLLVTNPFDVRRE